MPASRNACLSVDDLYSRLACASAVVREQWRRWGDVRDRADELAAHAPRLAAALADADRDLATAASAWCEDDSPWAAVEQAVVEADAACAAADRFLRRSQG